VKNEAAFWSDWLKRLLHQPARRMTAWKVPAETREGLPDCWFGHLAWAGWLELKYAPEWPVRPSTPVTIQVTAEQLAHLREAGIAGQAAFVLLGVDTEWFLLQPSGLRPDARLTHLELRAKAVAWGYRGQDDDLLLKALRVT